MVNKQQIRQGWRNIKPTDSARHSLAARGIKTTGATNRRIERLKELSEEGELDWERFQAVFLDEAEERLQEYFEVGKVEIDAEEADPTMRQRFNELRLEREEDGEIRQYSVFKDTAITLLDDEE